MEGCFRHCGAEGGSHGRPRRDETAYLGGGFLDGEAISLCKKNYGIDVLIPLRRNMDLYVDAMALFREPEVEWVECNERKEEEKEPIRPKPKAILKREKKRRKKLQQLKEQQPPPPPEEILVKTEAASIGEFQSWSSCTVPLSVVANRESYADGHTEIWFLVDTKEVQDPNQPRQEYHLRPSTEERYRQLKCFCDLTHFTPAPSRWSSIKSFLSCWPITSFKSTCCIRGGKN